MCAATCAVHLKIAFLPAFQRFSSRKSVPHTMVSDNASTFLAAAEELEKLMTSETLAHQLQSDHFASESVPAIVHSSITNEEQ